MKLTKSQLKRLIKEELRKTLQENYNISWDEFSNECGRAIKKEGWGYKMVNQFDALIRRANRGAFRRMGWTLQFDKDAAGQMGEYSDNIPLDLKFTVICTPTPGGRFDQKVEQACRAPQEQEQEI